MKQIKQGFDEFIMYKAHGIFIQINSCYKTL